MEFRQVVKNHSDINYVIGYLNTNHAKAASEGKPLVVTITCKQESLSAAQRRLYWLWMTEYGNYRGLDKEEASSFFKYKYLSVIYNRDNVGEYPETFRTMKELKRLVQANMKLCDSLLLIGSASQKQQQNR